MNEKALKYEVQYNLFYSGLYSPKVNFIIPGLIPGYLWLRKSQIYYLKQILNLLEKSKKK